MGNSYGHWLIGSRADALSRDMERLLWANSGRSRTMRRTTGMRKEPSFPDGLANGFKATVSFNGDGTARRLDLGAAAGNVKCSDRRTRRGANARI